MQIDCIHKLFLCIVNHQELPENTGTPTERPKSTVVKYEGNRQNIRLYPQLFPADKNKI